MANIIEDKPSRFSEFLQRVFFSGINHLFGHIAISHIYLKFQTLNKSSHHLYHSLINKNSY